MTQIETLHQLQLMIASEIKRVCLECDIPFFLMSGSLIGAVRHHGFIPWDDDMDIAMPREAYETFIKLFPDHTDLDTFFLENWDREEEFGLPFAKVKLNGTVFEEHSTKHTATHKGIYVDIFPLDALPDDRAAVERAASRLSVLVKVYKLRQGYLPTNPNHRAQYVLAKLIGVAGRLFPRAALKKAILREATRYNADERACCAALLAGSGNHSRDVFHKSAYEQIEWVPFESESMPIPAGYDEILTSLFGAYMQPPPVEERTFRHYPEHIDFGIYQ